MGFLLALNLVQKIMFSITQTNSFFIDCLLIFLSSVLVDQNPRESEPPKLPLYNCNSENVAHSPT